jgi:hypothetical protein
MGAKQRKPAAGSVAESDDEQTLPDVSAEQSTAREAEVDCDGLQMPDALSAQTDASSAQQPEEVDVVFEEPEQALHGREVNELELVALNWRRFAGIGPSELVELVAIGTGGIRVAYARGQSQYLKLLREGERLPGVTGVYQVANQLTNRVRQLCKAGHWVGTTRRASDLWVSERRVLPIDLDSVRPSGLSATDDEKARCFEAAHRIEAFLRQHIDPWAIGRGDSGNGLWLFIALQQVRRSEADDVQIAKLLKDLQKSFGSDRVKIDSTVSNASRLVPAFGTVKAKGKATAERPHRRTTFTCFGNVRRVQLSELFG